ncbi:MAG: hypothetical protein JW915_20630 [Chitinispirillaceae bacterium]|nr:hypothetical protein [Chitinispirillaceae bacterium]
MNDVTLQVNLSPLDYPKVVHLLPHQLNVFASQCNEQLIIIDLKKSSSKKSNGSLWDTNITPLMEYLHNLKRGNYPDLVIKEVDYSVETRKNMSKTIMMRGTIPDKDYSGGPYYSYFYGIYSAKNEYVLHIDADMMFGGGSKVWVEEALEILKKDSDVFSCSPLSGPPLLSQSKMPSFYRQKFNPVKIYHLPLSYLYTHFSTRVFLIKKEKLYRNISVQFPNFDHFIKAILRNAHPYRYPEGTISGLLKRKQWFRLDFYGKEPGLWCLHPCGNNAIKEVLPELIDSIEKKQFPDSQRGMGDVLEEYVMMLKNAQFG